MIESRRLLGTAGADQRPRCAGATRTVTVDQDSGPDDDRYRRVECPVCGRSFRTRIRLGATRAPIPHHREREATVPEAPIDLDVRAAENEPVPAYPWRYGPGEATAIELLAALTAQRAGGLAQAAKSVTMLQSLTDLLVEQEEAIDLWERVAAHSAPESGREAMGLRLACKRAAIVALRDRDEPRERKAARDFLRVVANHPHPHVAAYATDALASVIKGDRA
jgi:hypothetical protein